MSEQLTLTVDRNVPVPMRNGTLLYADVYRPAGPGPYPAVLAVDSFRRSSLAIDGQECQD